MSAGADFSRSCAGCGHITLKEVVWVKHLGDITKLDGHELPAVDVVIGGSPC